MSTINDHVNQAIKRLFQQYKGKVRIEALLTAFVDQVQMLEDTTQDLIVGRALDTAEGVQLDLLGEIVGQAREGMDDDAYRLRIKVRIIQNLSEGEAERAIQVYKALLGATLVVYSELYPASVYIMGGGDVPPAQVSSLKQNIEKVLPATVELVYFGKFDAVEPFSFSPSATIGRGFGDATDPLVGGKFGSLYI